MARRSQALQRDLPRPLQVNTAMVAAADSSQSDAQKVWRFVCTARRRLHENACYVWWQADVLITEEMVRMLQSDAVAYPVAPVHGLKAPAMHAFTDDELVQVGANRVAPLTLL